MWARRLAHAAAVMAVPVVQAQSAGAPEAVPSADESRVWTLAPVVVRGQEPEALPSVAAGGQVARGARMGILGNMDVMNTPFSVTSYTSKLMQDVQAATIADVLNRDASTRLTGQIGGVTDSFMIRGFPVNEGNLSEVAFDGIYGVSPNYHLFKEYLERVEVLKGPAALLYGMSPNSGVGGVINVVPKRPLARDLTRATLDYGSDARFGGALDISRRFGADRRFGIRFNGLHRQGSTPLDNQRARADVGALSLDYQGERFRATLDIIEQYETVDAPSRPFLVAPGIQVPSAPDGRRNVTQPWGWWKSNDSSTLLRTEYDVNDHLTAFADVGGTRTDVWRLSDQTPMIMNDRGDTSAMPQHWKFQVNRSTADAGLRAKFGTGSVKHVVTFQASFYHDRIANASQSGTSVLSNIYDPVSRPVQNIASPSDVPKVSESNLYGAALSDTMSMLDDRLQVTFGLRQQYVQSYNFNTRTGAKSASYSKSAITPLAGVVVKPWENVSFYANYIEGLSKGDIAPAVAANAGEVFAPYKARQHEVGVKVDFGRVRATLAAFRITKPSGQLSGSTFSVDGEQRNQGVELNISGELFKGMRLLGGVTVMDPKLTKTASADTVGNRPVGAPALMANAGVEWDVPGAAGLTLTGGVNHTGKVYVNQANTQSVPGWTTVDLGARYETKVSGHRTTFYAGIANVFDKKYWSGVASYGTISLGAPRTVFLSAAVDF